MTRHRSAGVIVFRLIESGVCEYLLLDHGRHWDFPKGHVNEKETDLAAARRELAEETGIADAVLIPGFMREIRYVFRTKRGLVQKTAVFYLAKTLTETVTLSDEHVGHAWLNFDMAARRLTYPNARDLLRHAEQFLRKNLTD